MDKNVLKKFAIESRQELMEKVANKINRYFIDEEFNVNQNGEVYVLVNDKHTLRLTKSEYENRQLLVKRIKEITLEQVIEEAAYTWFNRIIAIRYMEIHDYLPLTKDNQSLGVRVLSSKDNTPDPEIMKISNLINPDLDIEFNKEYYGTIQDNNKRFEYILLLVCKKLGKVIPQVFDGITDYIDILIPDNLLNDSGYINKLLDDVSEDNFEQVEIIGWLYQYYNQTEKDRVINAKKTYKKNEIAYATQLFTSDWIVKYMVENSLGKYWIEHGGDKKLIENWEYYIESETTKSKEKIKPEDIKCIDPCSGSGHILVYIFELLYQIYSSYGYQKKDIAELILTNNLYGLDIDDRAGQLSILSILLKAREYDKDIFNKNIDKKINIMSIQESDNISTSLFNISKENSEMLSNLVNKFNNAKEYGSLLNIKLENYDELIKELDNDETIFSIELRNKIKPLVKEANILSNKYDIVVTNPPYLSNGVMPKTLKDFLQKEYKNYNSDIYAAFIKKMFDYTKEDGMIGTISPFSWMFIKTFEELRKYIIENKDIESLIQLEYNSFEGACVPVATFVFRNKKDNCMGTYIKLSDFPGAEIQGIKTLEAIHGKTNYLYKIRMEDIKKIPGYPIIFWFSKKIFELFDLKKLKDYGILDSGNSTSGCNDYMFKKWYEIDNQKINKEWLYLNKGGSYRKWYGNLEYVTRKEFRSKKDTELKKAITWSDISSSYFSARVHLEGMTANNVGKRVYVDEKYYNYILGFMNTKFSQYLLKSILPTLHFDIGYVGLLPIIIDDKYINEISSIVQNSINLSKEDWDRNETSWNFKKLDIIDKNAHKIEDKIKEIENKSHERHELLMNNEIKLNEIFSNEIYHINDDFSYKIIDEDITLREFNTENEIKALISYAVGCMFGRYSLNKDGLVYAGGRFESVFEKYKGQNLVDENGQPLPGNNGGWAGVSLADYKYIFDGEKEIDLSYCPDIDNIIPLTEDNYFGDDIISRFKKFIEVVYGKENLYENLDYIAETLGKKNGENSEETIRRYFINDFYNDHVKMYQKRPIYWLFDSGKKNGFKCLIYMHRYNEGLVSKIRLDYLHRMQNTYEKELKEITDRLNNDVDLATKRELTKRQADISAKLQETNEYDEKIAHIADQKIKIDLDDGVVVNYAKFSVKNPKTGKDESILAKIK